MFVAEPDDRGAGGLMEIRLGGSQPATVAVPVVPAGLAVREGRLTVARYRWAMGPDPLVLAVGLRSACWIGPEDGTAPQLGRLTHRAPVVLDRRGRFRLDRNALGYLGVTDAARFEVIAVAVPTGGLLLVPVDDLEARLGRVHLPQ